MNFLHPALAWTAVGAIALPIVIHLLFRRRRVPVDWAAMELLREAIRRTNRRLKLEQWIVLALRSLAVLAAGLAMAVPFLGEGSVGSTRERTWIVVIDNGATSALRAGRGNELDRLRDEVRAMVEADRRQGDRFGIVTAAVPAAFVLTPTADLAEFERVLARIEPEETPSDLRGAIDIATGAVDGGETLGSLRSGESGEVSDRSRIDRVLVASAFRRASLREGEVFGVSSAATMDATTLPATESGDVASAPKRPGHEMIAVAPATDAPADVRIQRIETRAMPSGGTHVVRIELAREGAELDASSTRVRIVGDGWNAVEPREIRWEAGQPDAEVELQVVPVSVDAASGREQRSLTVALDEDALAVGNSAYAVIDLRREIEVAVVGRRGTLDGADIEKVPGSLWITRALAPGMGSGGGVRVREIDPASCDARALLGVDAVIVARPELLSQQSMDALADFLREGRLIVIVPAGESNSQTWASALLPKLSVPMRIDPEVRMSELGLRLRDEQPSSRLLASIVPELPALCAPIEATRSIRIADVTGDEVVLFLEDGSPFVVAQVPQDLVGGTSSSGAQEASADTNASGLGATPTRSGVSTSRRGLVVCIASSPELPWTNLPVKPLMVPLFQEVVRMGLELSRGGDRVLVGEPIRAGNGVFRLDRVDRTVAAIDTGPTGISRDMVSAAGIWRSDADAMIAANVRPESIATAPSSSDAVRAAFAAFGGVRIAKQSSANETNIQVSPRTSGWAFALFVVALSALLLEGMLSRIFSHASMLRAGGRDGGIVTVGRVVRRAGVRPQSLEAGVGGRDRARERTSAGESA